MEKPFLETDRLLLRKFELEDAGFIVELLNSPGWLEYIGDRHVSNEEEARTYLSNGPIQSYLTNGFGLSMAVLKDGNVPVGACGLLKREYLDHPDIGFAFLPAFMGKGYGLEGATAVMDYAKNELNLSRLFAFTIPKNIPSIKLLEKMGFSFEKTFTMPGEDEELLLFNKTF